MLNQIIPARISGCNERAQETSKLMPVNLIAIKSLFDQSVDHVAADRYFPVEPEIEWPKLKFFETNASCAELDQHNKLDLERVAEAAKQDAVIFRTLAETMHDQVTTSDKDILDSMGWLSWGPKVDRYVSFGSSMLVMICIGFIRTYIWSIDNA
jgi:hypothetical protein